MEANWVTAGGYPGPMFPRDHHPAGSERPGRGNERQLDRHRHRRDATPGSSPGDEILIAVYSGQRHGDPGLHDLAAGDHRPADDGHGRKRGLDQGRDGTSRSPAWSTCRPFADTVDPQNPMVTGTLVGADPITYTPDPVTPSLGSGQTVTLSNMTTASAVAGIYTLWIQGQAGSPYLTTKCEPARDQGRRPSPATSASPRARPSRSRAAVGDTVTFALNVKRLGHRLRRERQPHPSTARSQPVSAPTSSAQAPSPHRPAARTRR